MHDNLRHLQSCTIAVNMDLLHIHGSSATCLAISCCYVHHICLTGDSTSMLSAVTPDADIHDVFWKAGSHGSCELLEGAPVDALAATQAPPADHPAIMASHALCISMSWGTALPRFQMQACVVIHMAIAYPQHRCRLQIQFSRMLNSSFSRTFSLNVQI